ncbi:aminopeptidase [Robertkochia solimangrovi]|nr:aminopeptidase [Robertkochia solimangrovi]
MLNQKVAYVALTALIGMGILGGLKFNISMGDEVFVNAPYSVGFMIGLWSLSIILIATVQSFSLLFKEQDTNFGSIIFSTPINKDAFALERFCSFYIITLCWFLLLVIGYTIGLHLKQDAQINPGFSPWHFIYPFLIFGAINTLVVCSILFMIAQKFKNKLLVAVAGLSLYVFYMIAMMFSNAPFMAQALPQSLELQRISALSDIFGISGYFYEARDLSVFQRNQQVVPLSNLFLVNRILFILVSLAMIYFGMHTFSSLPGFKGKTLKKGAEIQRFTWYLNYFVAETKFNNTSKWKAVNSFIRVDLIYMLKSIAFLAICVLLVFYVGVDMFDDINQGIRLPQLYASSGLLAQTINRTFYELGGLVIIYFVNDIFWRSKMSGFFTIEYTTYYSVEQLTGHISSIILLILILTGILVLEGIVFQYVFQFPFIDWEAYLGVFFFTTFPLVLLALFLFFINSLSKTKSIALGLSILCYLLLATPIVRSFIGPSLLRFFTGYKGTYSDFIGYGEYFYPFLWRLLFGFSSISILILLHNRKRFPLNGWKKNIAVVTFLILAVLAALQYTSNYIPKKDKDEQRAEYISYEKKYRKYQSVNQPVIKKVTTEIDLYPDERFYKIQGEYMVMNMRRDPIDSILVQVPEEFEIKYLYYQYKNEKIEIHNSISELILEFPIKYRDSAKLSFEITYKWDPVNGHHPFNAIVKNGSFMRISRFYPQFGYDQEKELTNVQHREKYGLGKPTKLLKLEAPKEEVDDAIDLEMQISTYVNQMAIGTGELQSHWQEGARNYYTYVAESIPFRFAISSAIYQIKSTSYRDIAVNVYHHPKHKANVDHLIENTKLSLDYCLDNFGPYSFNTINYAEVSSFTQGFAGTAYPGTIFMTENMTFNADLRTARNGDVVNELAGHEVSHFWWGTNQIVPDYREGYSMLTESLAMYTELMIYKKMYGRKKMNERLAIYQQIYEAEKGFNSTKSLLRVAPDDTYLSYYKGAMVFVAISEIIGEDRLNRALKNFIIKYGNSNERPVSTDLLHEILGVSNISDHERVRSLFE